jgi:hypothetical protein
MKHKEKTVPLHTVISVLTHEEENNWIVRTSITRIHLQI